MKVGHFEIIEPVPELHNICAIAMLRPWIDVGRVGSLALTRLERHLGATELGRLSRPGTFFDFTRYRPRMRIVEGRRVFTTPNSVVYHAHDSDSDRDYVFLHLREPHAMGEEYTDAIISLLKTFDVSEHCRIGGFYDSVPHTRPLLVTGNITEEQSERSKGLLSVRQNTYQGPTSIVNLVHEALTQMNVTTTNLMVHLPQYVQLDEDHMGASRLIEVLCAMHGFPESLADNTRGQQQYLDIGRAVEKNPEVQNLIKQLEIYYDRVLTSPEPSSGVSFSPEMEKFLKEMGERLEFDSDGDGNSQDE